MATDLVIESAQLMDALIVIGNLGLEAQGQTAAFDLRDVGTAGRR